MNEHNQKSIFFISSLLISLYTLQGLIFGILLETLQLKLKQDFNYSEIGIYMLCSYPFSLKILWSPIVDTFYLKFIGLRKTWILIAQIMTGVILMYLSMSIDNLIHNKNIFILAIIAFVLMFSIATQDIAVDGWALTLCGKDVNYN